MDDKKITEFLVRYKSSTIEELKIIVDNKTNYQIEASYAALKKLVDIDVENKSDYERLITEEYECEPIWYYQHKGKNIGGLLPIEVRILLANGRLERSTKVWNEKMPEWKPLHDTELSKYIKTKIPPIDPDAIKKTKRKKLITQTIIASVIILFLIGFGLNKYNELKEQAICISAKNVVEDLVNKNPYLVNEKCLEVKILNKIAGNKYKGIAKMESQRQYFIEIEHLNDYVLVEIIPTSDIN